MYLKLGISNNFLLMGSQNFDFVFEWTLTRTSMALADVYNSLGACKIPLEFNHF